MSRKQLINELSNELSKRNEKETLVIKIGCEGRKISIGEYFELKQSKNN